MLRILKTAAMAAAFSLLALPAKAAVLLTVDVTDASAVTITATGAASEADATIDSFTGFSLLDFFGAIEELEALVTSSTLTSAQGGELITTYFSSDSTTALNLYDNTSNGSFVFEIGETAFTGSVTLDLSLVADLLPAAGTMGRIAIGDGLGGSPFGTEFGDFLVVTTVPVPAAAPLMILGLIGLRAARRRG